MSRSLLAVGLVAVVAAAVACSTNTVLVTGEGSDADGGAAVEAGPPGYPAPHAPMPQAVSRKGPVMAAPKLVTVTFQSDSLQASIEGFGSELAAAKPYWSGATSEYGVGALTVAAPVHVDEAPATTLTDADVQAWLASKIEGDGGAFPAPDANTIYAIYYPSATRVTMGGGTLCNDFQGYHNDFALTSAPGTFVTYAVIGRCPPAVSGLAEIDQLSAEASHEIIEAATDPLPQDKPAFIDVDLVGRAWSFIGGGAEIGDLCTPFPDAFYDTTGVTNLVQRVWSNAAAAASHAPCQPGGVSPYFNSAPVFPDTITVNSTQQGTFTTKGITIPVGESKTIELDLYSDAPTSGPWTVSAVDLTTFFGGAPSLSFSFDKTTGQNGDKIMLTIKAQSKSQLGASPFWIENDLGKQQTFWIGVVGN